MNIQLIINQQRITLNYLKMKKNNINLSSLFQLFMVILLIILGTTKMNAQLKVGNNPKTINSNALIEMESTSKGMLMPRLALVHPDSFTPMTAHIKGMIVFNTDSTSNVKPGLYYNSGTKWLKIPAAVVVNNGLTLANDSLQLGGTISKPTTINGLTDTNKIQFLGQGNNMFSINDSLFSVNGTMNNIGIGTKTPKNGAILELNSTNKGLLLPRVQLTSLISPLPLDSFYSGMVVYCRGNAGVAPNNVSEGFYISTSSSWVRMNPSIGDKGDITIGGDNQNLTMTIDNGVIVFEKLASSLKVGGGPPSNTSVALEVAGTNKGFVVSTVSNLNSIITPVIGMMVYSTTENCLRIFTDKGWSNCLMAAAGDLSSGGTAIVSAYSAAGNRSVNPKYGRIESTSTTLTATVSTIGSYNIIAKSPTLPGFTFTATGTFSATGSQVVTLFGSGPIPNAYINMIHTFTSNTSPSFTFNLTVTNVTYVPFSNGSTFNAFYNGVIDNVYSGTDSTIIHSTGEAFSFNSTCSGKIISQTAPANCPANITGASGTVYPLVWINGQCWMQTNLKEIPSNFPDTPNVGTNIWLNTISSDLGKWGYYDTVNTTGSAGWATKEPIASEGALYQWSAAMNNATAERSRGACPIGFHIPSDCEFKFLEHGLGLDIISQNTMGWRGNNLTGLSSKLRVQGTLQNNKSGFSGMLPGYRNADGSFRNRNNLVILWTSSIVKPQTVIMRQLNTGRKDVHRQENVISDAMSVRCLKD